MFYFMQINICNSKHWVYVYVSVPVLIICLINQPVVCSDRLTQTCCHQRLSVHPFQRSPSAIIQHPALLIQPLQGVMESLRSNELEFISPGVRVSSGFQMGSGARSSTGSATLVVHQWGFPLEPLRKAENRCRTIVPPAAVSESSLWFPARSDWQPLLVLCSMASSSSVQALISWC